MAFRLAPNGPQIKNQLAFTIIAEIVRLIRVVLLELAPHEVLVILARRQQARLAPITFGPGADRLTAPYTDIVKKKSKNGSATTYHSVTAVLSAYISFRKDFDCTTWL